MNILVTGELSTTARSLAEELLKNNHSVVITDTIPDFPVKKYKNFAAYELNTSDNFLQEIYQAYSFDAVIFISAQREDLLGVNKSLSTSSIDGLEEALSLSTQTGVDHFIFISTIDVYGHAEIGRENAIPKPSSGPCQVILSGENLCRFYSNKHNLSVSIVRIPFIYGPNEKNTFINRLIETVADEQVVHINTNPLTPYSFLHFDDLFVFLKLLLEDEKKHLFKIFNLNTKDINFSFLTQQLSYHISHTDFTFDDDHIVEHTTRNIEVIAAVEDYNWKPHHQLINDLPHLLDNFVDKQQDHKLLSQNFKSLIVKYRPLLVWGEVLLGAFIMHMLTIWTNTIIEFKYIDYRLLFVILIGSIHGLLFGIIAALLAAVSAAISWYGIGLDWALLMYNVENWIPFTVFFLAGAVTGYVHDKNNNEINFERMQTELIHEKYEFLYSLYDEISSIKNRLREQLVGYRDSFGRFFRIANELDELEENNVFLKALENLEEVMKNDQISIYSIESTGNYGRLEVRSKNLERPIPKSIKLVDFSIALDKLKEGSVFQNKDLLPGYPSYIAPISNKGNLIGLIFIWEADFEQFSLYYLNLFKVITGLIESSLVRAATFKNAQIEKLYIPSTQILRPDAFRKSLAIRKKMRRNKISNFLILRIKRNGEDWQTLYDRLSNGIRDDDIAGILNDNGEHYYVLLANAGIENLEIIQERLSGFGVNSEYIEDLEID